MVVTSSEVCQDQLQRLSEWASARSVARNRSLCFEFGRQSWCSLCTCCRRHPCHQDCSTGENIRAEECGKREKRERRWGDGGGWKWWWGGKGAIRVTPTDATATTTNFYLKKATYLGKSFNKTHCHFINTDFFQKDRRNVKWNCSLTSLRFRRRNLQWCTRCNCDSDTLEGRQSGSGRSLQSVPQWQHKQCALLSCLTQLILQWPCLISDTAQKTAPHGKECTC